MKKPILVVMAAGMGSRYGGLKQIDPVGANGEIIMDYSLYDAHKAGFEKVIFIIRREREADFRQVIGDRIQSVFEVTYVYQEVDSLPAGFTVPEGREKPWGTGHAVLCAEAAIDAPFVVINADDFYGRQAFASIFTFLCQQETSNTIPYSFGMVGYQLQNTLTENGHVARGVCELEGDKLVSITERTRIESRPEGVAYTEDGEHWIPLANDTTVSMNLWGFSADFTQELKKDFKRFLTQAVSQNPLKAEFFLPSVVNQLLLEKKAQVKVLLSADKWYGVTYKEDKPLVCAAVKKMTEEGLYPSKLW